MYVIFPFLPFNGVCWSFCGGVLFLLSCFFQTGFLCVALAVLELGCVDQVGLELIKIHLPLQSADIKGMRHHNLAKFLSSISSHISTYLKMRFVFFFNYSATQVLGLIACGTTPCRISFTITTVSYSNWQYSFLVMLLVWFGFNLRQGLTMKL